MAGATLTRRRPARPGAPAPRRRPIPWPALALAALALAAVVGFLAVPTFPNYDSYYSLVWGRELLQGELPSFEAYRAATQHPLAIAFGALLSLFGDGADRLLVGATLASFVALAAGLYRLARASFTPLVGLAAAALLCTRFDFASLATRAYIDIPYLALVIWAAALEAQRPRRGTPVLVLLAAAGLMRPEAWLLSGAYLAWCAIGAPWPRRIRYAALAAIGPVVWPTVDLIVTGDPLFSLTHTSAVAEELGRRRELGDLPSETVAILRAMAKTPVLYGGIAGLGIALALFRRRARVPLAVLLIGLGTWVLIGLAGLSMVYRYLLLPSLMVMLFAAVSLAGWTMLRPGSHARRLWALAAALLVAYGAAFTVTRLDVQALVDELRFRGDSHASLQALLRDPAVHAGRRCGPVSLPNHKLVPEVRWILGAGVDEVVARTDERQRPRVRRGVAVYATGQRSSQRYGRPDGFAAARELPGSRLVADEALYGAYVRC